MYGYGGRILTVDVGSGRQTVEALDAAFARTYLGGNGFAVKLCYDRIPAGIDPFDPRNLVVFCTGPVTDSPIPGNSRGCMGGKSPLNGLFFDSTYGGRFPGAQRHTGFDAIILAGAAAEPVYVVVDEQGATLKSAKDLWGKRTLEAAQTILGLEGQDGDVMSIGPAGEKRVRFSSLAHYWKNREGIAARGGLAAVLGSKNVKALVVRGKQKPEFANAEALKGLVAEMREPLKTGTFNLHTYGTPNLVKSINTMGGLGFFNNRMECSPDAEQVGAERYREEFRQKDTTCNKCSVACGKTFEVKAGEYAGTVWKMPEYESIYALGPMCGNLDPASLIKAEELCDQLGLDTISMGVTIAFAMECVEKRLPDGTAGRHAAPLGRSSGDQSPDRDDCAARGVRRRAGGRVGSHGGDTRPGGAEAHLRGEGAGDRRPLGARPQGDERRICHRHARRQPPRHPPGAPVFA